MKINKIFVILVLTFVAFTAMAQGHVDHGAIHQEYRATHSGSHNPPGVHQAADGHWTAWNPPSEFPEGAEVYHVQQGDTLWDLAGSRMGDPYLWPHIWANNQYIEDAHWIYPGDPLVVSLPLVLTDQLIEEVDFGPAHTPPVYDHDVYCSGFIRPGFSYPDMRIASSREYLRKALGEHDVVYLNQGSNDGVESGQEFFVMDLGKRVTEPDTTNRIGTLYSRKGQIKILVTLENSSIGIVTQSCGVMRPGMGLVPYEPIPLPWNVTRREDMPIYMAPNGKPIGQIIHAGEDAFIMAASQIIYINIGEDNDLLPGDKLVVFRPDVLADSYSERYWDLFRQTDPSTLDMDLFRFDSTGPVTNGMGSMRNMRSFSPDQDGVRPVDDRLPSHVNGDQRLPSHVRAGNSNTAPRQEGGPYDERLPTHAQRADAHNANSLYYDLPRKVFAEVVVLTTENNTAACRVLYSEQAILQGDFVEVQ